VDQEWGQTFSFEPIASPDTTTTKQLLAGDTGNVSETAMVEMEPESNEGDSADGH
jgi:hypothetical protein